MHIGFTLASPAEVVAFHSGLAEHRTVGVIEDDRPDEPYVSFRCWDPDGTEIEIYWDGSMRR